jgi:phosphatidylglycerophosphate synthase
VTLISIAIGLIAAAAFAAGSYGAGLLGALLFQLSAIVDCSDGEVARLTFSESKSGEQLDIVGDNVVHMAIFAAIAWGLVRQIGSEGASGGAAWIPAALGAAAVAANAVSLWLVARAKAIRERIGWRDSEQAAKVEFVLKNMASRDFSVILLLFALIGRLDWFLWLVAIGSNVFWVMLAWITRPSRIGPRA